MCALGGSKASQRFQIESGRGGSVGKKLTHLHHADKRVQFDGKYVRRK